MTEPIKRRLAVVLSFDVVGYSRLMEQDEEGSHRRMKDIMSDVVQPLLSQHEGRLVKSTGDGGLVEFESVVEAVRWALALQRAMATRNSGEAAAGRIDFRIGISLGDIIIEPNDIYGEGVNIATRLQSLAEPRGICITQTVAEQLRGKIDVVLVDLGEPRLKNISRPPRVYRVFDNEAKPAGAVLSRTALLPTISGFGGRPAIAVMPLDNFSGTPKQEYFADGLTEDITTALARWRRFPVISRNSAFAYKARKTDMRTVGRELGVRYIVEGSVRRHGPHVRIAVQLIEAETGLHVHAEQFDRERADVLGVQEEIATSIVGVLEPALLRVERDRAAVTPRSYTAYDLLQHGLWHHYRRTREDCEVAQVFLRDAIAADPDYSQAVAALSICLTQSVLSGWVEEPEKSIAESFALGQRAVFLDARDPLPHFALGVAALHSRQIALAIRENETAIHLNPSYAAAFANLGNLKNYTGHPQEAYESVARALRLSPNDPRVFIWIPALAGSHYLSSRYEQSIEAGRYGLAIKPDYLHSVRYVVAGLGQLGRLDEAAALLPTLRRLDAGLAQTAAFLGRYYVDRAALEHILDGLLKAGFA